MALRFPESAFSTALPPPPPPPRPQQLRVRDGLTSCTLRGEREDGNAGDGSGPLWHVSDCTASWKREYDTQQCCRASCPGAPYWYTFVPINKNGVHENGLFLWLFLLCHCSILHIPTLSRFLPAAALCDDFWLIF